VPAIRTEITEITTGLGMLGFPNLDRALAVRPSAVLNVEAEHYDRLLAARDSRAHDDLFAGAWRNGVEFARAAEGLRGRPPWWLEWKGNHRPPGYEQIPADLRVDHIYLISCKYGSNILSNSSPSNLFDRLLADRQDAGTDWFLDVAPDAYQTFYAACRGELGGDLPDRVSDLEQHHRKILKEGVPRSLRGDLEATYHALSVQVADASAKLWSERMRTRRTQEETLWRLLRLQSAPYFVLGESATGEPLRYRVGTPWDFRNAFRFVSMTAWRDPDRQQPVVQWVARVRDIGSDMELAVEGHVEVRWSHGRFAQAPEAKVYLDTAHDRVPGYFPLWDAGRGPGQLTLGFGIETA
jgi:hypothetical protein